MASVPQDLHFSRIIRAAEGLTQGRALLATIATFLSAAAVGALGSYTAMKAGGGTGTFVILALTAFVGFVVVATGFSAVGVMLMDRAKGIEVRSTVDAFVYGLLCLPKFILFALCVLALMLVVGLVAWVGYLVCKIPGLGPVLLVVAHPLFVFVTAVIAASLAWVAIPLFAPAIWEGRSFGESLSVMHAVARTRLIAVVVSFVLLYIVVGVVGSVVMSALVPSYLSMTGIAASVLGPEVSSAQSPGSVWQSVTGAIFGGGTGGGGSVIAVVIATLIIFGVAGALIAQVLLMGINLVYLIATDGLDISASKAALEGGLAQVRQRAAEAQERARQAADRARAAAQAASAAPQAQSAPPASAAASNCPKCRALVNPGDPFCQECGFKLR